MNSNKSLVAFVALRLFVTLPTQTHNGEKHGFRYALCILNKSFWAQSKTEYREKPEKKRQNTWFSCDLLQQTHWTARRKNSDCLTLLWKKNVYVFKIEVKWKGQFSTSVEAVVPFQVRFPFVFYVKLLNDKMRVTQTNRIDDIFRVP